MSDASGFLEDKVNNPVLVNQMKSLGFKPKGEGMTFEEAMMASQIASAVKGDSQAFNNVMRHSEKGHLSPLERYVEENDCRTEGKA